MSRLLIVIVMDGSIHTRPKGMDEKIAFRCGDGHEWHTSPANLVYKNVSDERHRHVICAFKEG